MIRLPVQPPPPFYGPRQLGNVPHRVTDGLAPLLLVLVPHCLCIGRREVCAARCLHCLPPPTPRRVCVDVAKQGVALSSIHLNGIKVNRPKRRRHTRVFCRKSRPVVSSSSPVTSLQHKRRLRGTSGRKSR